MTCSQEKADLDKEFAKLTADYEKAKPYFGAFGSVTQGVGLAAAACFVAGFTFGKGRLKPAGYDPTDAPLPGSSRWLPQPPPPVGYMEPPVTSHDVVNAPNLGCVVAIGNSVQTNQEAINAWNEFHKQVEVVNGKNNAYRECMNDHKILTEGEANEGEDESSDSGESDDSNGDTGGMSDSGIPAFE